MKRVYRVLVFPGGTEIGLEINRALRDCKDIKLFSAGLNVSNHAPYKFAQHFTIPGISDPAWIDALNQVIVNNEIDYVFPAYDDVIVALAEQETAIKATVVSSPLRTCLITRSKAQTYQLLSDTLPVPKTWTNIDSVEQFPVFVKPEKGQGSQRTCLVHDTEELKRQLEQNNDCIVSEYLPGEEYTVDCLQDRQAGLLYCSGRERIRTRAGISMNSRTVEDPIFEDYAQKIGSKLVLHGAWFFQVKRAQNGVLKLLEIGPRVAGTSALTCARGVNLPLLSIYEQARIPIEIMTNDGEIEIDRALDNTYKHDLKFTAVYVDLDDTLIINDAINTRLIAFLHQCVNSRIRIVLLTKHAADVNVTLKKHRISELFDAVVQIDRSANKSEYIRERDAILIDDSFCERRSVRNKLGIATFDCSMIETLLDNRA